MKEDLKLGGRPNRPEMSKLELQVMDVVWSLGDCTSSEVIEKFGSDKRKLAPTTIRTVLTNLRKKGYIKQIPSMDRGYKFRAIAKREAVARKTMKGLIGNLFSGSPGQAILHLLEDETISDQELEKIRRLIDAKKKGTKR